MNTLRIRSAIVCVGLVVAGLAFTSPARAADGAMTQRQAGRYYLAQICRENHAADVVNKALPLHHGRWKAKDMHGRTVVKVREAMRTAFQLDYKSGRKLLNPPAPWPSSVDGVVNKIANLSVKLSVAYRHLANDGKEGSAFAVEWNNKIAPPDGKITPLSAKVRAKLNLPPPGHGC